MSAAPVVTVSLDGVARVMNAPFAGDMPGDRTKRSREWNDLYAAHEVKRMAFLEEPTAKRWAALAEAAEAFKGFFAGARG